jgi:hypothetical protein
MECVMILGKVTNRVIPLFVFLGALCLWVVGFLEGSYPCMWVCGTIVSWMYLRFWQRHNNGTRGDAAENFGFDKYVRRFLRILHLIIILFQFFPDGVTTTHTSNMETVRKMLSAFRHLSAV